MDALSLKDLLPVPLATYRLAGPGAGTEDGVLADHSIGLGWGQPGHDHTAS